MSGTALTSLDSVKDESAFVKVSIDDVFCSDNYKYVYDNYVCFPEEDTTKLDSKIKIREKNVSEIIYRTPQYPKTPSEARKLETEEKKIWLEKPVIQVKLTKWQEKPVLVKEESALTTKDKKIKEKQTEVGQDTNPKPIYIYPYKNTRKDQGDKKPETQNTEKKQREPRYHRHNCVREEILREKLNSKKPRRKRSPYKPPFKSHNCLERHWSTEEIQVEEEEDQKASKKKKSKKSQALPTKTIKIRCLKPGLKPKTPYNLPNECNVIRKTIDDFLPKYLKQTHDSNTCEENQMPELDCGNNYCKKVKFLCQYFSFNFYQ